MSVIFGGSEQRIVKHTPYRIFMATLNHEQRQPFSSKTSWATTRHPLIEALDISLSFSLSHHGAHIKNIHSLHTYSLFDIFPDAQEIEELLTRFNITPGSTLSLDVTVELTKQYYLPDLKRSKPALLTFSSQQGPDTITEPYYWVSDDTPEQTAKYFELCHLPSMKNLSAEQDAIFAAGPGIRLGGSCNSDYAGVFWRSISGEAYEQSTLQEKLRVLLNEKYPEYSLLQDTQVNTIVEDYRIFAEQQNG